jgi:hypothetical protein
MPLDDAPGAPWEPVRAAGGMPLDDAPGAPWEPVRVAGGIAVEEAFAGFGAP